MGALLPPVLSAYTLSHAWLQFPPLSLFLFLFWLMVWQWQHGGIAGGIYPVVCPRPQGCGCCWGVQDCHPCSLAQSPRDPGQQRCLLGAVAVLHGWPRYEANLLTGNLLLPPVSTNPSSWLWNACDPLSSPRVSFHDMFCFYLLELPSLHFHLVLELLWSPLLSSRQIGTCFRSGRKART